MDVEEIKKISLAPNEMLLVKLPGKVTQEVMKIWAKKFQDCLGTQNVLVYCGESASLLKIALEEKLIEKLIDDEIQK